MPRVQEFRSVFFRETSQEEYLVFLTNINTDKLGLVKLNNQHRENLARLCRLYQEVFNKRNA